MVEPRQGLPVCYEHRHCFPSSPLGVVHDISKTMGVLDSVPSAQTVAWMSRRKEGIDPGNLGLPVYHTAGRSE